MMLLNEKEKSIIKRRTNMTSLLKSSIKIKNLYFTLLFKIVFLNSKAITSDSCESVLKLAPQIHKVINKLMLVRKVLWQLI